MTQRKRAVITGGAGGLGRALTTILVARGWTIIVLDLPGPELDAAGAIAGVKAIECDLTDMEKVRSVCESISRELVDLVIYNAGISQILPFSAYEPEGHRKVFDVNYFGAVDLAHGLLKAVRAARGTHLAITSVAGFAPLAGRTAYAASKHAMTGFFQSLRVEEKPFGVDVLIAAPSFVATNTGNAGEGGNGIVRPGSAQDGMDYMAPETAAAAIIRGYDRRRPMIPVGRVAWLAWMISRFWPRLYERLMERRFAKKD